MAKPLGPKSLLIREAITAHPDRGNTELAELIGSSDARKQDKITVTANDVAQQRQAMKKAGTAPAPTAKPGRKKPGKKPGRKPAAKPATVAAPSKPAAHRGPVELIDRLFELADDAGGMAALKRLVDRLAPLERA
jgi:hypothetical protein